MKNRAIGKITSIGIHGIIADVYEALGNYISTIDGVYFVGEIGSYVSIYEIGRTIIAEITGVEEKTNSVSNSEMNKPTSRRQIVLNLVGEIIDDKFYFGVSKMPMVFSELHIISENELSIMLDIKDDDQFIDNDGGNDNTRAVLLSIGKSVVFTDYDVKVNIDKFFGFHFAVFGNTGAGKSNTIARIIQNVFVKKNYSAKGAKLVIIDSNGEYNKAFSEINYVNPDINHKLFVVDDSANNNFEIPVWALSVEDWAILLHASEKTQIPVLRRAIDIARVFYKDESDNELKNHILASALMGILLSSDSSPSKSDKLKSLIARFSTEEIQLDTSYDGISVLEMITNSYGNMKNIDIAIAFFSQFINDELSFDVSDDIVTYDLNQFLEAVEFATLYEGSISSQRIQEYTSTLINRLQAIRNGVFGTIFSKTGYENLDQYIESLLGNNQIVDIDVSALDDSVAEVIAKVVAKIILDYLKRQEIKAEIPVNLIVEEAHRFMKNESSFGAVGYNIFERIAKEGRKYGMLLGISSQRPSELSKTVVSQCGNFIIHRVQNPDDLQYISKMVPYIDRNIISRLSYLQTGHALVFGSAINLPTLTKFDIAEPRTDSENARISEKWYIR